LYPKTIVLDTEKKVLSWEYESSQELVAVRIAYEIPNAIEDNVAKISNFLAKTLPKNELADLAANYLFTLRSNAPEFVIVGTPPAKSTKLVEKSCN